MITSDDGLRLAREQLVRVEAILESLRQEVKPKSERTFNLFAEGPLDLKQSLQADIEDYLARTTRPRTDAPTSMETTDTPSADRV